MFFLAGHSDETLYASIRKNENLTKTKTQLRLFLVKEVSNAPPSSIPLSVSISELLDLTVDFFMPNDRINLMNSRLTNRSSNQSYTSTSTSNAVMGVSTGVRPSTSVSNMGVATGVPIGVRPSIPTSNMGVATGVPIGVRSSIPTSNMGVTMGVSTKSTSNVVVAPTGMRPTFR